MELLVRIKDKINLDSIYADAKCMKRGDVIAVSPDGHAWGVQELANPEWRIISVPAMGQVEAEALLAPEPGTGAMLRKRGFFLNLALAPLAAVADLAYTGLRPAGMVPLTLTEARAMKETKIALVDPNILGPASSDVIG